MNFMDSESDEDFPVSKKKEATPKKVVESPKKVVEPPAEVPNPVID